jgi:hypothetical protein
MLQSRIDASLPPWLEEVNQDFAVVVIGGKVRIARWMPNPLMPEAQMIEFMQEADFIRLFVNRKVIVDSRSTTQGIAWLHHPDRREFTGGVLFAPGAEHSSKHLNLWTGFAIKPKRGPVKPFLDFILSVIADRDEELNQFIIAWLSDAVQNPGKRPGTALVLRGGQGVGKSFYGETICGLYRCHAMELTDPRHLTGNFNSHLLDKAMIFVDEGAFGHSAAINKLKNIVTSERMIVEPKGVDSFETRNCLRVIIVGNDKKLISAAGDERRYAVIDVGDSRKEDHEYFAGLAEWRDNGGISALLYYLKNYDCSGTNLRTAPRNDALLEIKRASLDPIDKWWQDRLMAGEPVPGCTWGDLIPRSEMHADYVTETGYPRDRALETEFGTRLNTLVPNLQGKRRPARGKRVWCYVLPTLEECRGAFDELLGQSIDWPDDTEN